jgi:hypothetical protein
MHHSFLFLIRFPQRLSRLVTKLRQHRLGIFKYLYDLAYDTYLLQNKFISNALHQLTGNHIVACWVSKDCTVRTAAPQARRHDCTRCTYKMFWPSLGFLGYVKLLYEAASMCVLDLGQPSTLHLQSYTYTNTSSSVYRASQFNSIHTSISLLESQYYISRT